MFIPLAFSCGLTSITLSSVPNSAGIKLNFRTIQGNCLLYFGAISAVPDSLCEAFAIAIVKIASKKTDAKSASEKQT
ncbi:hypothetical protein LU631_01105 [Erwinia tracheiphila]|uniref:hypothetical protein n=1 Tax=Erwinia tracheiphila TaxID=65700 RepID=UPI001F1E757C|nr:hypothetical protein [Erwinia tracheiphila]UIA88104.1 hypothetical protein LU631_01105 [Erwinia tracheiphila]UIA96697.1 hypothetical protein LU633_01105 [Erwinia tracheiphila]